MPSVRREAPFGVDVRGTLLVGSLDVYARDGERALVVDYKTGSAAAEAHDAHRLQAECYGLTVLEDGAREVEIVFTHGEGEDTVFEFDAEEHEVLLERIGGLIAETVSAPPAPLSEYSARLCPECPAYGATCPVSGPPAR